jgi:hypothetical protein
MRPSEITFFAATVATALLAGLSGCRREAVYIGFLEPEPIDTSSNPDSHPCDPDSVYFNQQILPILTSNCAMPQCHDAISQEEGVILDNYANTRNTGKINLGDPADSELYKLLNEPDPDDRMPPAPSPALPADQRALILQWIEQGALDLTCEADCDTANVTFSGSVMPLIGLKCQGCHSGATPNGGVLLTNYTQVKATITDGSLLGSIDHQTGFKPMPYPAGSAKLPYCDIRKIRIWVDRGAPND